jgi:hypothetical protein
MINDFEYFAVRQGPGVDLKDISNEEYRSYDFVDTISANLLTLAIENPVGLWVRPSGAHNVIDRYGVVHYVPKTWVSFQWKPRHGTPMIEF